MITDIAVNLKRIPWGPEIEASVERLNPVYGVTVLKAKVESGAFGLFEISVEDRRLGVLITRLDTMLDGSKELVIMHAVGDFKTSQNLVGVLSFAFDNLARMHKVKVIRVHTSRRGMDALLEENGYQFIENVYKKRID